jgi:hypothetical protein
MTPHSQTMARPTINTDEFRRDAINFLRDGYYTDAPRGTKAYLDYWREQDRRCKEGYSVGGVRITGYHYFYLNFNQILLVDEEAMRQAKVGTRKGAVQKIQTFPAFWDGDYEYFWAVDIAQHGMEREDYEKLQLETNILDLDGGHHLVVLKARGKGYSYKSGSMLSRNYALGHKSKNFAIAEERDYLTRDGLLNKVWDNISFLDRHTAWRQPRLKDTDMHKVCGYKQRTAAGFVERGRMNEVMGVTLKNDADKARGKRGDLAFFEEAGKCPGLLKAWEVARPSFEQGSVTTGLMIAFGTGGTEEANYAGLEELYYYPEANNCLPFENIWDEGGQGTKAGFFMPAYQNWQGYMDEDGNSDVEGARDYLNKQRDLKKQSKDNKALDQFICENPFTPQEATLQVTQNLFPTAELVAQLNKVKVKGLHSSLLQGRLYRTGEGKVELLPTNDPSVIFQYPTRKGDDERGAVWVLEKPYRDASGKTPSGMYIIGHDPYAHDKSTGASLGSAHVFKRSNPFSLTYNECIVASYTGRPATLDDYNDNLFLLADYYNAKIGFENDRGDVIGYAKRTRQLDMLEEEFEMLHKKELQSQTVSRPYGMHMTDQRKSTAEIYIRDWLNTVVTRFGDGKVLKVYNTILDPALLTELIKFNRDGNFDRVMALMIGMYFLKEMEVKSYVPRKTENRFKEFFEREWFV